MMLFIRPTLVNLILMMVFAVILVAAPTLKGADAARTDSGNRATGHQMIVDTSSPQLTQQSPPIYWAIEDFDSPADPIPQAFIAAFGPDAYWQVPASPNSRATIDAADLLVPGTIPGQGARLIHYSGDSLTVKGNLESYGPGIKDIYITVVTNGTFDITADIRNINFINAGQHPAFTDGGPVDYLLFMSTKGAQLSTCSGSIAETGISWSAYNSAWRGIIYVPNGTVEMNISGNDSQGTGAMIAWCVYLSGSHIDLIGDPDMLPTIGIAE